MNRNVNTTEKYAKTELSSQKRVLAGLSTEMFNLLVRLGYFFFSYSKAGGLHDHNIRSMKNLW